MGLGRATNFPTYHDGSRSSLPRCWVIGSYFLYGLGGLDSHLAFSHCCPEDDALESRVSAGMVNGRAQPCNTNQYSHISALWFSRDSFKAIHLKNKLGRSRSFQGTGIEGQQVSTLHVTSFQSCEVVPLAFHSFLLAQNKMEFHRW